MPGPRPPEGIPPTEEVERPAVALPAGLRLLVTRGPDAGRAVLLPPGTHVVGKDPAATLALTDPSVSWRHLELLVGPDCVRARDLGSRNGSAYRGSRFEAIELGAGAALSVGQTELRLVGPPLQGLPLYGADRLASLVGASVAMREVFSLVERVARTTAPVLVTGETGTGKELVADALHRLSSRAAAPLVVCDLAAMPATLVESELFGHVRGAFTGADRAREGTFELAHGGTIFLDELGELDRSLQPRLLRALETGQIKPVGAAAYRTVDVRIVAATNRDLEAEIRAGAFREDLYHRIAVVTVHLAPLRERSEDVPLLVRHFLGELSRPLGRPAPEVDEASLEALAAHDWPGNVRELRNVVERALSLDPGGEVLDLGRLGLGERPPRAAVDATVPFRQAKENLVSAWERDYVSGLLERNGGNVTLAARQAGMDRVYLHRLMKKHGFSGR